MCTFDYSMTFCTLTVFDLLSSNLPGAKADSQWGRRIWHFKMAATQKHRFSYSWPTKLCKFVYKHAILHTYRLGPAEFKYSGSQIRFSMGSLYLTFKNGRHPKNTDFPISGQLNCANLSTSMTFCTLKVLDQLNSNQIRAEADSQWGRRI